MLIQCYSTTFGLVALQHQGEMFCNNLTLGFGLNDYEDIDRQTAMRGTTRTHSGDTEGEQIMVALTGKVDLWRYGAATFGPVYGLVYQKVNVDSYTETGADFDSLGYSLQSRESLLAEVGLFGKIQVNDKFALDITLVREEELSGDKTTPDTYLVTLPFNRFNLPGTDVEEGYWRAGIKAEALLTDNVALSAAFNYRKGDDYESSSLVNLGLQVTF